MDIEEKMVFASKENLRFFGLKGTVVHGDALELADALERARAKRIDAIVSDLPYGRSTTLAGRKLQELITKFVAQAESALGPGRFMVLCINDGRLVELAIRGTQFKVMERFERRVHKSLTRHFFVMKKSSRK
jgi:tRNA (guanine10-N2)-dimethyltransferase